VIATVEKSLPCNLDAERMVLGSILLDAASFDGVSILTDADFSLEKHRRIFCRMRDLHGRAERIDPIAVYNELDRHGEAQACDGLGYLHDLTEGIPQIPNLDGYIRIVQEKGILRRAIFAMQHLMNRCLRAEESSGDILLAAQKTLDALSDGTQKHGEWITPTEVVRNYPGGVHQFVSRKQGGVGIATPWEPITETLGGGLHPGDLFLVAGRPSMGKSIIGMSLAYHAAKTGCGAAVFSLEMSKESLTERLLCGIAGVDSQRLRAGYLTATEKNRLLEAAADLETLPLWIDDTRARTVPAITAALRKLCAKHSIAVVVIDHLQLMTSSAKKRDQRNQELSEILHEFKHESGKLNATFVVLSQLNRQCEIENRVPQLSDLKETGAAEEDADVVMFVHRPERYAKNHNREDLCGHAEFIIAKQRCGPTGLKSMVFLGGIQKFECCARSSMEGDAA
jgi:replicative DNA helicase